MKAFVRFYVFRLFFDYLRYIVAMIFFVSLLLVFIRFGGPILQICGVKAKGANQKVNCFGLMEFTGEDIFSIYRVKFFIY